jgi:hypothetical protein
MAGAKYKVGAIGFAHSHMLENLKAFETCGDRVEFVAAADITPRVPSSLTCAGSRNGDLLYAVDRYHLKKFAGASFLRPKRNRRAKGQGA